MKRFLQKIMDRRPTKVYQVNGEDLFYRAYLFRLLGWTFYLHHYLRSDPDRGLHNHPFSAIAIVLAGGYWEERLLGLDENGLVTIWRKLNPGAINRIDQNCFHKLELPQKIRYDWYKEPDSPRAVREFYEETSWSLFICKYIPGKSWGFLSNTDELHKEYFKKPEGIANFCFRRAGVAETDHGWFKTAPKGRENCRIR